MPTSYGRNKTLLLFLVTVLQVARTGTRSTSAQEEGHQVMNPPDTSITASITTDNIRVTVVMVNRNPEPFPLLKWNLPVDGKLTADLFDVQGDGKRQPYVGEIVKRHITTDDYVLLQPGTKYTSTISLGQGYDVKVAAEYRLRYKAWNQLPDGGLVAITSTAIKVEKR